MKSETESYHESYHTPHIFLRRQIVKVPHIGEWDEGQVIDNELFSGIDHEYVRVDFPDIPIPHDRILNATIQVFARQDGWFDVVSVISVATDEQLAHAELHAAEQQIQQLEAAARIQRLFDELDEEGI